MAGNQITYAGQGGAEDREKTDLADYSHLMLSSMYSVNANLVARDGQNKVMYWDNHPVEGGGAMKILDSTATTMTSPAVTYMSQFGGDDSWKKSAGMSLDGLFVPYDTAFKVRNDGGKDSDLNRPLDDTGFPAFERPYSTAKEGGVDDRVAFKEVGQHEDLGVNAPGPAFITSISLNPFASGHFIARLNKNETLTNPSQVAVGGGFSTDVATLVDAPTKQKNTARPIGLRGPMVMAGWGYDIYENPVPNLRFDAEYRHNEPGAANYGRQRYVPPPMQAKSVSGMQEDHKHFIPVHMRRPDQWKVGPVDLRWDHQRKVWVGGKHNGIYLSKATKCILPQAGLDGNNSFNFGVGGNVNAPGRLYRNPCPTHDCTHTSYFPTSIYYPDIEIYDPEDHNWCGRCRTLGHLTACSDFKDGCAPFYDAIILRPIDEVVGKPNTLTECTDKFRKVQGGAPGSRRAGNPCHGWGSSYFGEKEFVNRKIGEDKTWTQHAKAMMYEKIFIENPLGQGLMVGDAFFSYDTGKRIVYEYERMIDPSCGQTSGTTVTVKEAIPVHIILQAEFYGMEILSHAGCDRGEMAACSKKFFAQGFATAEDCGPDDDYPQTAGL